MREGIFTLISHSYSRSSIHLKIFLGASTIYPCSKITHWPFYSGLALQLEARQGGCHICHPVSHTSSMNINIFPA
jgi:hypothetical protein